MSANDDAARCDMRAGRIERCLAADMTVKERYALNKVAESSLYKWMARFREEDPDRFPRRSSEASSWMKVTRPGIADAAAIVAAPGGGVAVNPFTTPDAIYISKRPQDMRAGIQRLASIVAADFGRDPMDGALYCFVSRDYEKMKLLRFDVNGWCMYYVRLAEGGFKWRHSEGGELLPDIGRRQLLWLLEGLPAELPQAAAPVAAGKVL